MDNKKNALFIVNPNAGRKQMRTELFPVISELLKCGIVPTVRYTDYAGHATELAESASAEDYNLLICSGGDGTLNEVVTGIMQSDDNISLGYIPAGSTCDFAKTFGIPRNTIGAAKNIGRGTACNIDIGRLGSRYFSYVASFGMFTKASYATNQTAKNLFGKAAYLVEAAKDVMVSHNHRVKIETDDGTIEDNIMFGAIVNTTSIGGVVTIDPDAVNLNDGMFEYLFIRTPDNLSQFVEIVDAVTACRYDHKDVYFGRSGKFLLHCEEELDWSLDGEHFSPGRDAEIENIHDAISIILPHEI